MKDIEDKKNKLIPPPFAENIMEFVLLVLPEVEPVPIVTEVNIKEENLISFNDTQTIVKDAKAELEIQAKLEAERLATLEKARIAEEMLKQDRYKVGKLPIIGASSEKKLNIVGIFTIKDFLNNLDLVVKTTGYKIETLKPAIDKAKLLLAEIKL